MVVLSLEFHLIKLRLLTVTQGVKVIRLDDDKQRVSSITVVPRDLEGEDEEEIIEEAPAINE